MTAFSFYLGNREPERIKGIPPAAPLLLRHPEVQFTPTISFRTNLGPGIRGLVTTLSEALTSFSTTLGVRYYLERREEFEVPAEVSGRDRRAEGLGVRRLDATCPLTAGMYRRY